MKSLLIATLIFLSAAPIALTQSQLPSGDYPAHMFSEEFFDQAGNRNNAARKLDENRIVKKGPLAVSLSDRTLLKDFLQQPDTGLLRLYPREANYKLVSPVAKLSEALRGGAYYSFANHSHGYGFGSDIQFERGKLSAGIQGYDYGVFTNLGDVPLTEITFKDSRIAFLASYAPARRSQDAKSEKSRFSHGFETGGMLYEGKIPAAPGTTYLLRSIIYGGERSDVLVAFRVMSEDKDQGLTIAWKLLKKYRVSHLPRAGQIPNRQPRMKWPIR
jgi:hypothetical protein